MNTQKGFTMIELVVVIVILGLLSAVAIPKYLDMQANASIASLNGLVGAMKASVATVKGSWYAQGRVSPVILDSGSVTVNGSGYPSATQAGIGAAIDTSGYSVNAWVCPLGVCTFTIRAGCTATYTEATGVAVLFSTTGC